MRVSTDKFQRRACGFAFRNRPYSTIQWLSPQQYLPNLNLHDATGLPKRTVLALLSLSCQSSVEAYMGRYTENIYIPERICILLAVDRMFTHKAMFASKKASYNGWGNQDLCEAPLQVLLSVENPVGIAGPILPHSIIAGRQVERQLPT